MKDVWRYASTTNGEQWLMMDGAPTMLRLSVNNLDFLLMVRHGSNQSLSFRAIMFILVCCTIHAGVQYFGSAYFGQGNGFIFLDNVTCNGSEASLLSCSYSTPGSSDSHSEDVGVKCPGQQCFTHSIHACRIKLHVNGHSCSIMLRDSRSLSDWVSKF